jgi:hypothetical protein
LISTKIITELTELTHNLRFHRSWCTQSRNVTRSIVSSQAAPKNSPQEHRRPRFSSPDTLVKEQASSERNSDPSGDPNRTLIMSEEASKQHLWGRLVMNLI